MAQHDRYISPFSTRYASDEMQYIFSDVALSNPNIVTTSKINIKIAEKIES